MLLNHLISNTKNKQNENIYLSLKKKKIIFFLLYIYYYYYYYYYFIIIINYKK